MSGSVSAVEKNKAGKWASGGRGYDLNGGPGKASLRRTREKSSEGGVEGAMQARGRGLQAEGMLTRWWGHTAGALGAGVELAREEWEQMRSEQKRAPRQMTGASEATVRALSGILSKSAAS